MLTTEERSALEEEDQYWFEELFYRDLESWFSSDIACCDNCYDEFLENWPHAYAADDAAFQRSGIDLRCFYSGSRLRDVYTEEQFFKFLRLLECPRCGKELKYNIWPYSLPFDVVKGFEEYMVEISELSQSTPFLILKHRFAQEIYDAIKNLSEITQSTTLPGSLYRARASVSLEKIEASDFDFPPNNVVSEGRYNHAGIPTLYLGSTPETCFHEMREVACHIAEIKINKSIKILDLASPYDAHEKYYDLLNTLVYSALMSAKQDNTGWHRPKYIFSRFISDCAKSVGFDAIKYPSTRGGGESYNLAILNKYFSLKNSSNLVRIFSHE
ncbi:RES family NAD+ phosphorylase [Chromobacterium vaccinii]|nr:RES family NAD+ phosphorylase [Chromobacterium vaccinii]